MIKQLLLQLCKPDIVQAMALHICVEVVQEFEYSKYAKLSQSAKRGASSEAGRDECV